MQIGDYPAQEPLSDFGRSYQEECLRLSEGIGGAEHRYDTGHPSQGLLVFPAARPNGTVLAFMHGGGWTNGYKEMMAFLAPPLNQAGISFVSIGYRLAPEFTFPAGWLDAAKAMRWVYDHCAQFGGDPGRIFLGGHSAGAHQAALLAVRTDWLASHRLPENPVRGCLPISGTYYFTEGSGLSMRPRFLGPAGQGNEVHASPIHYLDRAPPPMLIAHGSADFPHLSKQARDMEQRIRSAGGQVERIELPGCDHLGAVYCAARTDGPWLPHALKFMAAPPERRL